MTGERGKRTMPGDETLSHTTAHVLSHIDLRDRGTFFPD